MLSEMMETSVGKRLTAWVVAFYQARRAHRGVDTLLCFRQFQSSRFVASATEVEGLIETISTSGVDPGCSERHQVTGPMLPTHQLLTEVGEDG